MVSEMPWHFARLLRRSSRRRVHDRDSFPAFPPPNTLRRSRDLSVPAHKKSNSWSSAHPHRSPSQEKPLHLGKRGFQSKSHRKDASRGSGELSGGFRASHKRKSHSCFFHLLQVNNFPIKLNSGSGSGDATSCILLMSFICVCIPCAFSCQDNF